MLSIGDTVRYKTFRGLIIGVELDTYIVRFWSRNQAGRVYRWILYLEADDLR